MAVAGSITAEGTMHQRWDVGAYSCANALLLCGILYVFWRKNLDPSSLSEGRRRLARPGSTLALALVLYGFTRSLIECIRDDNPYEFSFLTISQILGMVLIVVGVALLVILASARPDAAPDE